MTAEQDFEDWWAHLRKDDFTVYGAARLSYMTALRLVDRDAERYRWMRLHGMRWNDSVEFMKTEELDAYIDQAMEDKS